MSTDERLRQVFADVLGVDASAVREDASPMTIPAWDSIAHLNLVLAIEGEFSVQFEAEEIPDLTSFIALRERLARMEPTSG